MSINLEVSMEKLILEAAEKLFLEKGFDLTSTTQIAKEAGCNQALVHYYFRTKDNLFNMIFESKFNAFFQQVFDSTHLTSLSFIDKIKYISNSHFDLLLENPNMPKLLVNELSRRKENISILREKLKDIPEKLFAMMNTELQEEIKAKRIKDLTFIDILFVVISLNVSLFLMFPLAADLLNFSERQRKLIVNQRKTENLNVILSYLRP